MTKNNFLPSWVIIPAAGSGSRMQSEIPKQYLALAGKTVLEHTLDSIAKVPHVKGIVVALSEDDNYWQDISKPTSCKVLRAVGGKERFHSVLNALDLIKDDVAEDDWVMVHDAARPCFDLRDIEKLHTYIQQNNCSAILGKKVSSTLKIVEGSKIAGTQDREKLWEAQTPQMSTFAKLHKALNQVVKDGVHITDDAQALMHCGEEVGLVEGSAKNIKITWPGEVELAASYLRELEK